MFKVGERIEGRWKNGTAYYLGTVSGKNDDGTSNPNGTYHVKFDDGCVEESEPGAHLRKLVVFTPPLPVASSSSSVTPVPTSFADGTTYFMGQRIEARWKLSAKYYTGVVTATNPDGSYGIRFDDGCFEPNEHESHIRLAIVLKSAAPGSLRVGDVVKAKFKGSPKYFIGKIASLHANGTFRIDFVDGSHDDHVPLTDIITLKADSVLFVVSNGTLYRVDSKSGDSDKLSSVWSKTTSMCRHKDHLFLIDNGSLYRASPSDGSHVRLPGSWSHTSAFTSFHDNLYLIDNESLYRVDPHPHSGASERLPDTWPNVTGFC